MKTWLYAIILIALSAPAYSQDGSALGDYGFGHDEWHDWYNTGENGGPLMRPNQKHTKCCDGDCRPTVAAFKNGAWKVYVDRGWEPVPEHVIKWGLTPPNGTAHVCASKRTEHSKPIIFCFIVPEAGT